MVGIGALVVVVIGAYFAFKVLTSGGSNPVVTDPLGLRKHLSRVQEAVDVPLQAVKILIVSWQIITEVGLR